LSLKIKVYDLSLVLPQNRWDGLSVIWHQNYWDDFLRFGLKIDGNGFLLFDLKIGVDGFLVKLQREVGGGFSGLGIKTGSYGLVI
jgi:hypothetical protein